MSRTDIRKLIANLSVLIALVIGLIFILNTHGQSFTFRLRQDPKAEIRHKHREARYNSEKDYRWWKRFWKMGWSQRPDGEQGPEGLRILFDYFGCVKTLTIG